jgi:hypothetical protein
MAPNIGDSIKNAVEGAVDRVQDVAEDLVDKVKGHSDDAHDESETDTVAADDAAPSAEPTPMVVETAAIDEPLEFEREDTHGNTRTLTFEPADEAPHVDRPNTTD